MASFDAQVEAFEVAAGIAVQREVVERDRRGRIDLRRWPRLECKWYRLAGRIEHAQVGEAGLYGALVDRMWKLDRVERLAAAGLDEYPEGKIVRPFGSRAGGRG